MTAQKKQKQVEVEIGDTVELKAAPEPEPEAEADEPDKLEMVELEFRGYKFTIPKLMDEWATEACLAMNEGNYVLSAKLLLGFRQWQLLMSLGDKRKDIREFLTVFANVVDRDCVE